MNKGTKWKTREYEEERNREERRRKEKKKKIVDERGNFGKKMKKKAEIIGDRETETLQLMKGNFFSTHSVYSPSTKLPG